MWYGSFSWSSLLYTTASSSYLEGGKGHFVVAGVEERIATEWPEILSADKQPSKCMPCSAGCEHMQAPHPGSWGVRWSGRAQMSQADSPAAPISSDVPHAPVKAFGVTCKGTDTKRWGNCEAGNSAIKVPGCRASMHTAGAAGCSNLGGVGCGGQGAARCYIHALSLEPPTCEIPCP